MLYRINGIAKLEIPVKGRDLITGLPKEIIINDAQIRKALSRSIKMIIDAVKETIENTPPELVADIMNKGIIMVGGGSLLRKLDKCFKIIRRYQLEMLKLPSIRTDVPSIIVTGAPIWGVSSRKT